MSIIDFHSHILPQIDDGSKSLKTTQSMLSMMSRQEVDYVIATPHFYATKDRIEDFLARRQSAWEKVQEEIESKETPQILLGSEVAFFKGISDADRIDDLTIANSDVLLLEMPFEEWRTSYIEEVEYLIQEREFQIVLAHLERYMNIKENKKKIRELMDLPLYVQINAESLLDWRKRGKVIKMFKNGEAHLLGSDCHGIHHRVPNLAEGRDVLWKKAGRGVLRQIDRLGEELILEEE